jgi:hypothetical protein
MSQLLLSSVTQQECPAISETLPCMLTVMKQEVAQAGGAQRWGGRRLAADLFCTVRAEVDVATTPL